MDILLYKDGHLSISESPLQGKENNLDDVIMLVSNPQDGDTLTYKGGKWVNGEGGGGSFAPDITNPQDGDTLVYDASEEKWVNGSGGGSGGGTLKVNLNAQTYTADKTWKEIYDAMKTGVIVVVVMDDGGNGVNHKFVMAAYNDSGDYIIELDVDGNLLLKTDSENGYPVMQQG